MNNPLLWSERSSAWLYFYQYLLLLGFGLVLSHFVGPLALIGSLLGCLYLVLEAKSLRAELYADRIELRCGIIQQEHARIDLATLRVLVVVDRNPWRFLHLGTVLLVTHPAHECTMCVKCIRDPMALAERLRRLAMARGSGDMLIQVMG